MQGTSGEPWFRAEPRPAQRVHRNVNLRDFITTNRGTGQSEQACHSRSLPHDSEDQARCITTGGLL